MAGYYPRLRDLREDADLSQTALVNELGMEPPFSLIIRLAKRYNVSIDYIAGLTNTPTPLDKKKK